MKVTTNRENLIGADLYQSNKLVPQPQYAYYAELLNTGVQHIDTSIFTSPDILDNHFFQILAIMQDGIETEQCQTAQVFVHFVDNEVVKLSIFDYWFNLIFWGLPVAANAPVTSKYLWFYLDIDQDSISNYVNSFLEDYRDKFENIPLNNMIDDVMFRFQYIDKFSLFLYNTANNEDTLDLMRTNPAFYDAVHCDLSSVDIVEVKNKGQEYTDQGINAIIESKHHWAEPYFRSKQGINRKQFRELLFNIGTVPDDDGSIYPKPINGNFCNRGITDPVDYLIEARKSRRAQILGHQNVGTSGAFARILNLNNMDERLHRDPNYVCDSKHFVEIDIKDKKTLSMYKNRYYRLTPNGQEFKMSQEPLKHEHHLIGKHIYFRSPITCSSRSKGLGICHRCYGGLAKTNHDINVGTIAAELLSSKLTQRLLSAKHLLESNVRQMKWCQFFGTFFELNFNTIRLKEDEDWKKFRMVVMVDDIYSDDEDDENADAFQFDKFITRFTVLDGRGNPYEIRTEDNDNMYFTVEFSKIIKKKAPDGDGAITINFEDLKGKNLFFITVINDGLSSTLDRIKHLLDRGADIKNLETKDAVTQELVDTIVKGGLSIDAIHLEILLANQCVSAESSLLNPEWQYPNATYKMVTLNERLRDNPSVCVSLMYKDIKKLLFYPLTFQKSKASSIDLFYMISPQNYMGFEPIANNIVEDKEVEGKIKPFIFEDLEDLEYTKLDDMDEE